MRSARAVPLRAVTRYRVPLAALAPVVFLAMASSTQLASSGASGRPRAGKPAGLPAQQPAVRPVDHYRIVGCRSHGTVAYLHGPARREVAIGFDDGPAPDTGAFVSMLQRSRARATFFMIGEQVSASYRPTLLRELRNGDVLGDHTFTHPDLIQSGGVRAQLERTIAAIRALTGYTPCVFRPPYGDYDQSIIQTARSLGLATVLWDVDPSDYTLPGIGAIEQRVLAQVRPGSIIISHDGGGPRGQTLAAYPAIIASLRARGYRILTIPELLGFRPVYVPCIRLCEGIGVPRSALPRDAIVERAPQRRPSTDRTRPGGGRAGAGF
jgi:peptidoglycan/xylan/chitin deacetylase (PgdA/CDA1 family)